MAGLVYGIGLAASILGLLICAADLTRDIARDRRGMTEHDVRLTLYGHRSRR